MATLPRSIALDPRSRARSGPHGVGPGPDTIASSAPGDPGATGTGPLPERPPGPTPADVLALQAALLGHDAFDVAATALATALARHIGASRVTLGMSEAGHCRVVATSGLADIDAATDRLHAVQRAMDEAIEQAATIQHPAAEDGRPRIALAHAELGHRAGCAVVTVPLVVGREAVGAMTIEGVPPATVAPLAEQIAGQLAPVLALKHAAGWPLRTRLRHGWRALWSGGRGETRGLRHAVVAVVLLLLAGLLAVPVEYRVGAPARVEGAVQRMLTAPSDGFLREAHVKPGDRVRKGDLLVEMADQELAIERNKWAAELSQHENNYRTAFARGDRTQYVVHHAKAREAQAQLQLVEEQLARSRLSAPFDGTVIKGDLTQALGSPVKRGDALLTVAPSDAFRLIVEVDERDIARVQASSRGALALSAFPDRPIEFEVVRITPMATNRDGRNFYEVEGSVAAVDLPLRPGLQGIAKIRAGERPLAWSWSHRLIDWIRLQLWSLGG